MKNHSISVFDCSMNMPHLTNQKQVGENPNIFEGSSEMSESPFELFVSIIIAVLR